MASDLDISEFIQHRLRSLRLSEVTAVDAARWLDEAQLLSDSASRPGKPLRVLLRAGRIESARQEANGRWFISRAEKSKSPRGARRTAQGTLDAKLAAAPAPRTTKLPVAGDAVEEAARRLAVEHGLVIDLRGLPAAPGLYTLSVRAADAITELRLEMFEPDASLTSRILYLGKSQSSIADRLGGTHFVTGKSGHSTVRRTFGALLGLSAIPRPSRIDNPTRKQLMTATANFAFTAADEKRLTRWMLSNIEIRAYATSMTPLATLEREVGARLKPPLDQEQEPFWSPNPWREPVAQVRERIRHALRRELGIAPR